MRPTPAGWAGEDLLAGLYTSAGRVAGERRVAQGQGAEVVEEHAAHRVLEHAGRPETRAPPASSLPLGAPQRASELQEPQPSVTDQALASGGARPCLASGPLRGEAWSAAMWPVVDGVG
jgi:hypothetical protein